MTMTAAAKKATHHVDVQNSFRTVQYEIARQHAVDVLFAIYLVLMLCGLIRKYVLPDFQRVLIALRDPFVLYLYIHALRTGLVQRSAFIVTGLLLATFTVLVVGLQMGSSSVPAFLMMFGFRMYYSLLLLPFIIAAVFRHEDMQRFFRLNLILIMFMAPLMVLQVLSPSDSWINIGRSFDESLQFGNLSYGDFVRPSGFFTNTGGAGPFITLVGAVVLAIALLPKQERPCSQRLFLVGVGSLMVAAAVCGNRGAILGLLFVGIGGLLLRFILPLGHRTASRAVVGSVAIAGGGFIVALVFFPENFMSLQERWIGANSDTGSFQIFIRALDSFVDFISFIETVPPQGIGLGAGTNAASAYYITSSYGYEAESGWSRHIVDLGPFLGIIFIVWRIAFTIYLVAMALKFARQYGDPRAWLIFAAMGHIILFGQTSGNSDISGLAWFAAGLILAAPTYVRSFR